MTRAWRGLQATILHEWRGRGAGMARACPVPPGREHDTTLLENPNSGIWQPTEQSWAQRCSIPATTVASDKRWRTLSPRERTVAYDAPPRQGYISQLGICCFSKWNKKELPCPANALHPRVKPRWDDNTERSGAAGGLPPTAPTIITYTQSGRREGGPTSLRLTLLHPPSPTVLTKQEHIVSIRTSCGTEYRVPNRVPRARRRLLAAALRGGGGTPPTKGACRSPAGPRSVVPAGFPDSLDTPSSFSGEQEETVRRDVGNPGRSGQKFPRAVENHGMLPNERLGASAHHSSSHLVGGNGVPWDFARGICDRDRAGQERRTPPHQRWRLMWCGKLTGGGGGGGICDRDRAGQPPLPSAPPTRPGRRARAGWTRHEARVSAPESAQGFTITPPLFVPAPAAAGRAGRLMWCGTLAWKGFCLARVPSISRAAADRAASGQIPARGQTPARGQRLDTSIRCAPGPILLTTTLVRDVPASAHRFTYRVGKRQRTRTGHGPDAGRTIYFEETDADRTRTGRGRGRFGHQCTASPSLPPPHTTHTDTLLRGRPCPGEGEMAAPAPVSLNSIVRPAFGPCPLSFLPGVMLAYARPLPPYFPGQQGGGT
eukprot:gene18892-biopygen3975